MYYKSLFLLFSLSITKLSATIICIVETPCKCVMNGGQVIDLSTVGNVGFPRFYDISANDSLYSYNPCYPFDSPDTHATVKKGNKPCSNAAACVKTPGSSDGEPPEEHAIGLASNFKFDCQDGLYINYTVPGAGQNLAVKLICDNSTLHHLTIDTPEDEDNPHVAMTLKSKCACPNGCVSAIIPETPSGLSTGSKLLIAFFTITLAYFIVGMIWNFCNGAKGVELIPNLDFWNELPKLIIEGVAFSCSCFGRKSSYGEV